MLEIKNCPFCGRKPRYGEWEGTYGYTPKHYFIKCECGAEMNLYDDYNKTTEECTYELIEKWNKRV